MMPRKYSYYGFGLHLSSDMELPLPGSDAAGKPDVTITFGKIPADIDCEKKISSYWISRDAFILNVKNIKLFAGSGREIIIESPENEAFIPDNIIPFILSSCMGALLHQRNRLTLQASTVMTKNGAVVFMGHSSSGKSTLAAVLGQKGYRVLSDAICPIELTNGRAVMLPSCEKLQIWKDIINKLKIPEESVTRVRPSIEKYYYTIDRNFTEAVNLSAIYLLNSSNQGLYRIVDGYSGSQKLNILKSNIYMKNFAKEMCVEQQYFKILKHLAITVPVKEFIKPNNEFKPEKLAEILEEDFVQ